MLKRLFVLLVLSCVSLRGAAPAAAGDPLLTTAYQTINLFEGPGITYRQLDRILAGVPMIILERNAIGTWVHIDRRREDGSSIENGWVISDYLNLDPDLHFADVPVNADLPDAVPDPDQPALDALYALPIIPTISSAMRDVFGRGHDEQRNYAHVITKVGDSLTADSLYLKPMSLSRRVLGAYDYLDPTIQFFGASTQSDSVAARIGMTSYTIFDPAWADKSVCEPRETPLDCEYRRKRPSIAFILFGPNDVLHMSDVEFDVQMRAIVDNTLNHGIIPVLSTFSYDPGMGLWYQSVNFNTRLIGISNDYGVPLINLWLAARSLPNYGLENDQVHMKHWGFDYLKFDHGYPAFSGAALRNLLTIRTLDEIRNTIMLPAEGE